MTCTVTDVRCTYVKRFGFDLDRVRVKGESWRVSTGIGKVVVDGGPLYTIFLSTSFKIDVDFSKLTSVKSFGVLVHPYS